jgi:putative hemolysin
MRCSIRKGTHNDIMEVKVIRKKLRTLLIWSSVLILASCTVEAASPTADANLPNPASVHCEQNGGKLEIRQDATGGQVGYCLFPDGSECEEWAFSRGECKPGESLVKVEPTAPLEPTMSPNENSTPQPASPEDVASDGCRLYRNEALGYQFHYPAQAEVIQNDEPLRSITIAGPVMDGESWPQITISHPADRQDYRPFEGADLETWLTEHNLLGDERQADLLIAGVPAIHLRHERSPQSYAYDRYYFAKSGQLYMIVIGHSGDKEDWELYNHFLESFRFEQ